MPIDRRGGDASRNVSLGPFPRVRHVGRQIGAAGASERSSRDSSTRSTIADEAHRINELAGTIPTSGTAPSDAPQSVVDRTAVSRAMVACGVIRDDGVWITQCAWCDRVRTIQGDWETLDHGIRAAMPVERTHGICPQCAEASDPATR